MLTLRRESTRALISLLLIVSTCSSPEDRGPVAGRAHCVLTRPGLPAGSGAHACIWPRVRVQVQASAQVVGRARVGCGRAWLLRSP